MSILKEMFSDEQDEFTPPESKLLARGDFTYNPEAVIAGYDLFRRRYTRKQTALRLMVAFVALGSAIFMVLTETDKKIPIICIVLSLICIAWFIRTPIESRRKNRESLEELKGEEYTAEIYNDTVKIILKNPPAPPQEQEQDDDELANEPAENPFTVIHLEQFAAEFLETETFYLIAVAKKYMFVIPKSAFTDEENENIRKTLTDELESRYKLLI
ncbi:MAG: hypothetical protein LBM87_05965 [Ruminococcus sp.]|jgi:hypothetical protein|nr:hypothetical protein [Ruminococcus sp.]